MFWQLQLPQQRQSITTYMTVETTLLQQFGSFQNYFDLSNINECSKYHNYSKQLQPCNLTNTEFTIWKLYNVFQLP